MARYLLFVLFIFSGVGHNYAQDIQWASQLEFQFNHFDNESWSGKQVLGPPNALPPGSLNEKAYRMKQNSAFGTLVVGFKEPHPVQKILIVENHDPGRIVEVALFDENGSRYSIYDGMEESLKSDHRTFYLDIPRTKYNVAKIEVNLSSINKKGWPQIDAIGIVDAEEFTGDGNQGIINTQNLQEVISFTSEKENLGITINSQFDEAKPIISPDGKTLYFVRQNCPSNFKGKKDLQDIYYSQMIDDKWLMAKNLGFPLNDQYANGVCSVSPDGKNLLLINGYDPHGKIRNGVSFSDKISDRWSKPEMLHIIDFYNNGEYQDYFLSNSGKYLIMALERNDTRGGQDLYVSFQQGNGEWTAPLNLGRHINTSGAEFSPFLASDDRTLYFASNGRGGFGESDIFYTKRIDDTWESWTEPKNLGEKVNSKEWDAYYSVSAEGDYAYFVSSSGGSSNSQDIFRIALPKEFKPDPVLLITGNVYNAKTNEPIRSKIIFEDLFKGKEEGTAYSNSDDGTYTIILPRGKNYGYLAQAKGFISINENIDLTDINDYDEIRQDLYLVPLEKGQTVKMNNLFFEQSKAELLKESFPELERLVQLMKDNPNLMIELAGHTDNQGLANLNYDLSLDRVEVIKEFLVNRGVDKKRIETVGYGGTKPIASNADPETRALNRRVEIKILEL